MASLVFYLNSVVWCPDLLFLQSPCTLAIPSKINIVRDIFKKISSFLSMFLYQLLPVRHNY